MGKNYTQKVIEFSDGNRSFVEISNMCGCCKQTVATIVNRLGLPRKYPKDCCLHLHLSEKQQKRITELSDGIRSTAEIAELIDSSRKSVKKFQKRNNLPQKGMGSSYGKRNPSWKGGKLVDLDGYILVPAPFDHPYARYLSGKHRGRILEHRLVMEQQLGRYLLPQETVDHIDGNTLNNHPDNLRLFENNSDHLQETLAGKCPHWSQEGKEKLLKNAKTKHLHKSTQPQIDTYNQNKKSGEIRKQRILNAQLLLGKDHPSLLGMDRYLIEKQDSSHQKKETE